MKFLASSTQMLAWRAASLILGVVTASHLARMLGPVDRGVLAIFALSVSLGAVILDFGVSPASIYLIGSKTFRAAEVACTIFWYFCGLIVLLGAPAYVLTVRLSNTSPIEAVVVVASVGATVLLGSMRHILLGQQQFNRYCLSIVVEGVIYTTTLLLFFSFWRPSVLGALVAYLVSVLSVLPMIVVTTIGVSSVFSVRHLRPEIVTTSLKHGIHLFIAGLSGFGMQRINYFLLQWISGMHAVGLFTAASAVPTLFSNLPQQVSTVLYSQISGSSDQGRNVHLTTAVVKLMACISVALLVPFGLFSGSIMNFMFGSEFSGTGRVTLILSIAMAFSGLTGLFYNSLAGSADFKWGSYMSAANIGMVSIFGLFFIHWIGVEGAAWSSLITAACSFLIIASVYCIKFSISPHACLVPTKQDLGVLFGRRPEFSGRDEVGTRVDPPVPALSIRSENVACPKGSRDEQLLRMTNR